MNQSRFNAAHLKSFLGTVLVMLGLGLFAPASHAASGAFTFSASSYSAGEGTAKVDIIINRVGGSKGAATVQWSTSAGTASSQDFAGFGPTTLSFADKETQKVQTIQLVNDALSEPNETFTVSLAKATKGTTLGDITSATITILDNDAAAVDTTAPSVAIASPTSGSTFTSPQTMAVAVNATDNVGVARVELYDGAALLGSKSAAPYNFSFAVSSASNGNHSLSAKAFDAAGNSKVSAAANITVSIPVADATAPSVSLSSPANGTTYSTAQTVTISASATDNVGVSKVEFYDGAALLGSDSAAPYSFAWPITSASNGSHSLTAKAFDAAGNAANSATSSVNVNIAVAPATYVAPVLNSVTINSGNYVLSWSLPPTAYGTPAGGYNVYVDGVDDNLNNFTLSSVKSGLAQDVEHCFTVEARWTQAVPEVFSASNQVCVAAVVAAPAPAPVADTTLPTVAISSPATGATYTSAQTVTVAVSASDNVGVSKVELYDGTSLLGSDTAAPYSFDWAITSGSNGSHSLTAKAFDAAGNAANSATSSVNVNIAVAPAIYVAPVLNSVTINSGNYVLSWSLPPTAYGTPAGGYNVYVDGVDDNLNNFTLSSVKSGLAQDVEHCFSVEARWTQAVPGVFSASNQVCVAAVVAAPAPAPVADTTLPTVAISSPAAGATYTSAQTVTVAVSASDNVGVSKVELYDGAALLGSDTVAPYSFDWAITSGSNGSHSLAAKAYDAAGNVKSSSPVALSVNIATSSSVTLRPDGKLPVFPGAEGFGAGAVAGRGGSIIKVTNLNDSGPGSFRAAVSASGPRIVVFEVGGTIQLLNTVFITNPYLTIAGQTAPEPGIQLKGYGLEIDSHDVLIQHLRVRITAPTVDGIRVFAQRTANYNIVIDHVTANWATDENMSIWGGASGPGVHDITISNCLIAESGYGLLIGSYVQQANHMNNISVIDNLFAHNGERDPVVSNNSNVLVANNLAYNPTYEFTALVGTDGPMKVTFIGNHYVTGANSLGSSAIGLASTSVGSFYLKDNLLTGVVSRSMTNSRLQSYLATQPTVVDPTVSISPATAVKNHVTTFAGARPDTRDSVEQRIVTEVMTESGVQKKSGTWPAEYNTPSYRTFSGGSNPNGDDDGDGYTNVEEILHQMAAFVEGR